MVICNQTTRQVIEQDERYTSSLDVKLLHPGAVTKVHDLGDFDGWILFINLVRLTHQSQPRKQLLSVIIAADVGRNTSGHVPLRLTHTTNVTASFADQLEDVVELFTGEFHVVLPQLFLMNRMGPIAMSHQTSAWWRWTVW